MPAFDHFLLTRFSAVLSPGAPPPAEEWLDYRLGFFYDVTYPSVRAQRGADATWLVIFDDRCSPEFRATVEDLAADGTFVPLWTHEPWRRDSFAAAVAERSTAPYVITTRIDSDDGIAADFLAAVQARFAEQELLFVNFTRGLQVDRGGAVYLFDNLSSPFLSLVERRREGEPPMTVYAPKHARARTHGPLLEVVAPPMWLQVVHDTNLSNIVTGTRTDPAVLRERFSITLPYRAAIGRWRLRAEELRHLVRLAGLWWRHPGELTRFVEVKYWRLRGTHVRPQGDARTLTDRLATLLARFHLPTHRPR
ncbi:Putative rhamnosyl transferase [Raineyella antarctica]|uniref:Putative rhamnosyl transferase n=1 Tax=Raineyella antarctica TaxID=1577474 RepID=A0A1G6GFE3_9ACTN|nr:glycosyltransferase [Raineyella antarctica]SDB79886.1 Putative rhamnosyl transferase [Raineyella antarctica]